MAAEIRKPIWKPSADKIEQSNLSAYIKFLSKDYQLNFQNYDALYEWSVNDPTLFWESIWSFTGIICSKKFSSVLKGSDIRKANWFEDARLNFAENLLRFSSTKEAIIYWSEGGKPVRISFKELHQKVAGLAAALKSSGVKKGDRVAAFISNRPEAIIGMLAATAIGAIWSSCSPDFGFQGVLDRFGQIKPKVLIAVNGYSYNGKKVDLTNVVSNISQSIPGIEKIILISGNSQAAKIDSAKIIWWDDYLEKNPGLLTFEQLPFDHPLYIMYSSGTTGKPKCIVHGAGGTLLQHLKELILHTNLKPENTITYYTTCGWMMWNWLVSSLAVGSTIFLYDGSPGYPTLKILFEAIEKEKINIFGTSPKFLSSCESAMLKPGSDFNLDSLHTILSTGAPLSEQNFEYVYSTIKKDVQLSSISGGTDIISCFMLGNPNIPVYPGELQCRGLGMKVETFNDEGKSVLDMVGELVCTAPFPSRPIYFWNDKSGEKYHQAYFNQYTNIWRHGDYVKIYKDGACVVYGRSDATLNPGGIRIGTSEIYGPVEALPEVAEALAIGRKTANDTQIILFVVLEHGLTLTSELEIKIKEAIRKERTPRHVPSDIYQVTDIPRTISGKKVELAVTKIIHQQAITNRDALANPESLDQFVKYIS